MIVHGRPSDDATHDVGYEYYSRLACLGDPNTSTLHTGFSE